MAFYQFTPVAHTGSHNYRRHFSILPPPGSNPFRLFRKGKNYIFTEDSSIRVNNLNFNPGNLSSFPKEFPWHKFIR